MRQNIHNLARILTAAAVFIATPAMAGAPVKAFGAEVLVGDVVRSCPPELCALAVVSSPLPGQVRTVNKRDVEIAVRRAGGDPSALRIPERVRVIRPAKTISKEELQQQVEAAVKAALPAGFVLDDIGVMSTMDVPKAGFEVRALWSGGDTFHRRAVIPIEFLSEGMKFRGAQVSVLLALETEVPTAARDLAAGTLVRQADIRWKRVRLESGAAELSLSEADVVGRLLETEVSSGSPFEKRVLKRVPVVREGERLTLESVFGLVRVSALAVSRGDGAVGDRIRVVTMADNRMVWARVMGPGKGMVVP